MGQKIFLSSNGYDFLESYTKALYENRGSFRHNLERYVHGAEFTGNCRNPTNVDEIPELTMEAMQSQIERESYFSNLSSHVMGVYAQREQSNELTDKDYYEIAGIMRLCPGHCDWCETLFPHLVDLFVSSEEEGRELLGSVERQPNIISVMVTVMSDGIRSGQIINYNGRDLWSQGYARNYFRGENAYNKCCRPSLYRYLPESPEDLVTYKVIGNLHMMEFSLWLQKLSFVCNWPFGDVFHGAIAQHYGIPTNALDITSDLKTALFFACCQYENGKWRPLREEEFEYADSRTAVAQRGGDSRYGIIFMAPADISNMSRIANIPELHFTGVTPVGFQPFMRCGNQSSYIIEAGEQFDLYRDMSFSKFKFRHTSEICNWIFREMQEGRQVYPNEKFGDCEDIVATIQCTEQYSAEAFQCVMKYMNMESKADEIKKSLHQLGYQCIVDLSICSEERLKEFESNWNNARIGNNLSAPPSQIRLEFCI